MESYIVRVIRRYQAERNKRLHMEGVVEGVESRGRQAFHSATELWTILAGVRGEGVNGEEITESRKGAESAKER